MSFHLEGPWLSTTGKRKGKFKYRSSEQKKQAQQLDQDWIDLKKKYQVDHEQKKHRYAMNTSVYKPPKVYVRETAVIPSLNNGVDSGPALRAANKVYTGTKIIGIGTMHKSNAVPIFSNNEAKEISSMRR